MLLIITMCILQEARNVDAYSKKLQDRWQKKPHKNICLVRKNILFLLTVIRCCFSGRNKLQMTSGYSRFHISSQKWNNLLIYPNVLKYVLEWCNRFLLQITDMSLSDPAYIMSKGQSHSGCPICHRGQDYKVNKAKRKKSPSKSKIKNVLNIC